MANDLSYCRVFFDKDGVHKEYHDKEYGFPIESDDALFGRLILEINQAGLSWETILKKKKNFHNAYSGFDVKKIAAYTENDRNRLLSDVGIIRNKLKVNAVIHNANQILSLQNGFGSFKNWLDHNHPLNRDQWVKLFKQTFKFTGGEITNEFLMSTGYIKGAHNSKCPIYDLVLKKNPMWKMNINS